MRKTSVNRKRPLKLICWLSALLFVYGFLLGGQQLLMGTIAESFGLGTAGMGGLVSAQHVCVALAPAILGAAADRFGKKRLLVLFAFVFGCGCQTASLSSGLAVFLLSACLIGAGYSVCESLTSAVCVDLDAENGARYINLTQCLLSAGAIVGPIVLSGLPPLPVEAWRLLYGGCAVALLLLGLLLGKSTFPQAASKPEDLPREQPLLLSPVLLALLAGIFIYVGLENGFGYFIEPLFREKGAGAALGAYGIAAYWAGMTVSRLLYSLRPYRPRRAVRYSFLGAAAAYLLLIACRSGYACICLCGLVGFAYGPIWSTLVAGAAAAFPRHKASATGVMSAGCGLGGIVYPTLMGVITDTRDLRFGFAALAVSACVGAGLAAVLKNQKQGECGYEKQP